MFCSKNTIQYDMCQHDHWMIRNEHGKGGFQIILADTYNFDFDSLRLVLDLIDLSSIKRNSFKNLSVSQHFFQGFCKQNHN